MKKYILLFVLAFAMVGATNAQTTKTDAPETKVSVADKDESSQKMTSAEKPVTAKVVKASSCNKTSKGCCKNKKGNAQASANNETEKKACCDKMADAKDGKACCDKMAEKVKAEDKKIAKKS